MRMLPAEFYVSIRLTIATGGWYYSLTYCRAGDIAKMNLDTDAKTILYAVVGTVIGGLILASVIALVALIWRKALQPRVRSRWRRLQRHRRNWAIKRLKKAIAKKLISEGLTWQIDCRRYENALGEARRDELDLFSNFQLNTPIAPTDYKIAQALEILAEERTLHKVVQEPFGGYAGARPHYAFTYHSGSQASYETEQQLLELEAACMKYNSNTQGFSDACPKPRYQLYNTSDEPGTIRLAVKKREDGPEHCARCWETQH